MNLFFLLTASVSLLSFSCNSQQEHNINKKNIKMQSQRSFDISIIENNFQTVSLSDINNKSITLDGNSNYFVPAIVLSDIFLEPINEIQYSKSYIESTYKSYFKYKINDTLWLLAYHHHYDLHDYDIVWILYNNQKRLITSKIIVEGINQYLSRELKSFNGKEFSIYNKYQRHFENEIEGDNKKPIINEINYIIKGDKFVAVD
jgi:hypothetical protein